MRLSARLASLFAFSLTIACLEARAWDWLPSRERGAYIENVQYGLETWVNEFGNENKALKLKVTLHGIGEYTLVQASYGDVYQNWSNTLYQSLVQAKADSLPVLLFADPVSRTFERVLIGNIDPDFPLALRRIPAAEAAGRATSRLGFDPLGRSRPAASARVPLWARPAPAR